MFIVNAGPGFQKIIWPAAQKLLDAKTIGKIQVEERRGFFSSLSSGSTSTSWISAFLICTLQVLEPKSLDKLLEAIDPRFSSPYCLYKHTCLKKNVDFCIWYFLFSQLPDFLGGSCTCSVEGRCLRSNKGPWSDPAIIKVGWCFTIFFLARLFSLKFK